MTYSLQPVDEDIWTARAAQRFFGLEVGARMTVMRLSGGVLVHSPIDRPRDEVRHLGPLRWAIAPNLLHHLYLAPWIEAGAQAWGPPGLPEKRNDLEFEGVIEHPSEPFGPEVLVVPLRSMDLTRELVLLHRPSRTLVATDLLYNVADDAPLVTRLAMRALGGYPGVRVTVLEKLAMKRQVARTEVDHLLSLDFDRLVMAHGEIVETGGKEALAGAFTWL